MTETSVMKELNSTSLISIRKRQILVPKEGSLRVNDDNLGMFITSMHILRIKSTTMHSLLCLRNQLHEFWNYKYVMPKKPVT